MKVFILDTLGNTDMRYLGKINQEPARDTHLSRQSRSLRANGILDNLNEDIFSFVQQSLDGFAGILTLAQPPNVGKMQESSTT